MSWEQCQKVKCKNKFGWHNLSLKAAGARSRKISLSCSARLNCPPSVAISVIACLWVSTVLSVCIEYCYSVTVSLMSSFVILRRRIYDHRNHAAEIWDLRNANKTKVEESFRQSGLHSQESFKCPLQTASNQNNRIRVSQLKFLPQPELTLFIINFLNN